MPAILMMLAQTLLPQLITALEPAIANLLSAHSSGDAAAIDAAIKGVAAASADAIALNTMIKTCTAENRDPTSAELAPFASHLAAAVAKLQADIGGSTAP